MPEVCFHRGDGDAVSRRPRRLVPVPSMQAHLVRAAGRSRAAEARRGAQL